MQTLLKEITQTFRDITQSLNMDSITHSKHLETVQQVYDGIITNWEGKILLFTIASLLVWLMWKVYCKKKKKGLTRDEDYLGLQCLATYGPAISKIIWLWPAFRSLNILLQNVFSINLYDYLFIDPFIIIGPIASALLQCIKHYKQNSMVATQNNDVEGDIKMDVLFINESAGLAKHFVIFAAIATLIASLGWMSKVWIIKILLFWATAIGGRLIWKLIYFGMKNGEILHSYKEKLWLQVIIDPLLKPISLFIWLIPGLAALNIASKQLFDGKLFSLEPSIPLAITAIILWAGIKTIHFIENHILTLKSHDETTVHAIAKIARLCFIFISIMMCLSALGLSLSGLLTFGGVGGLIAGLAAQDLLANFFGGIMIYFERPFKIGHWIRSPDRNIEGTVEQIGLRMTVIRTFDKRPIYVPNSVFSTIILENPSRMLNRRIYETIGLRYEDSAKLPQILTQVHEMLVQHPDIDTKQTLMVNLNQFASSSLDFFVYTFTKTTDWVTYHRIKQEVLLKIIEIIHAHDADIAFPTQVLKVDPQHADGQQVPPVLQEKQLVAEPASLTDYTTSGSQV